jgi:flagellin
MLSIQTNYASLVAQNNLQVNSNFQTKTIEQITSGYRINSAGDDAAGLAVANGYRDSIAELTQGVQNANDGVSTLQIIDGGLNNISTMLDRMQTLATESASSTFTGDRNTLDNEYQQLVGEITRQASDIGLVSGGTNSTNMSVFIGGGPSGGALNLSQVGIALGGVSVDSTGLGLTNTSVAGADQGVRFNGAADVRTGTFLQNTVASYTVNTANGTYTASVGGTGTAQSGAALVASLNQQLGGSGVSARINNTDGKVEFVGGAFSITSGATAAALTGANSATVTNSAMYNQNSLAWAGTVATASQNLTFTVGGTQTAVALGIGVTETGAVNAINQAMNSKGIYALQDSAGNIDIQGNVGFTTATNAATGGAGFLGAAVGAATAPTVTGSGTTAATNAISAVSSALATLGQVQGTVGAGENKLGYATQLAESQITNLSSAESQIRDADMATEAANLTKAQVLQQASLAAMAQANSAPQAVLSLLKG